MILHVRCIDTPKLWQLWQRLPSRTHWNSTCCNLPRHLSGKFSGIHPGRKFFDMTSRTAKKLARRLLFTHCQGQCPSETGDFLLSHVSPDRIYRLLQDEWQPFQTLSLYIIRNVPRETLVQYWIFALGSIHFSGARWIELSKPAEEVVLKSAVQQWFNMTIWSLLVFTIFTLHDLHDMHEKPLRPLLARPQATHFTRPVCQAYEWRSPARPGHAYAICSTPTTAEVGCSLRWKNNWLWSRETNAEMDVCSAGAVKLFSFLFNHATLPHKHLQDFPVWRSHSNFEFQQWRNRWSGCLQLFSCLPGSFWHPSISTQQLDIEVEDSHAPYSNCIRPNCPPKRIPDISGYPGLVPAYNLIIIRPTVQRYSMDDVHWFCAILGAAQSPRTIMQGKLRACTYQYQNISKRNIVVDDSKW